ncbi:MAG TPA: hypothetical protein ENH28_00365 [Euryarchaeota archaeon]|nr:hypothetical protein BMS3Bbin15_01974 [archaeon BMS3Bbin15]HDL14606.1 hypothetical protein [Euryarchaeota archaeon]
MIGTTEFWMLFLAIYYILLIFYIHDIIKRKDLITVEKTFWVVIIFILNFLGIILYIIAKTWRYYNLGRKGRLEE